MGCGEVGSFGENRKGKREDNEGTDKICDAEQFKYRKRCRGRQSRVVLVSLLGLSLELDGRLHMERQLGEALKAVSLARNQSSRHKVKVACAPLR